MCSTRSFPRLGALALTLALTGGCGSSQVTPSHEPDPASARTDQLDQEREALVQSTAARIGEIAAEINDLEIVLAMASAFPDGEQRIRWSEQLFELHQEKERVRMELDQATRTNVSPRELRDAVVVSLEGLQTALHRLRAQVELASSAPQTAQKMMCGAGAGALEVDTAREPRAVVMRITTRDPASVEALRLRAKQLSAQPHYAVGLGGPLDKVAVQMRAFDIVGGSEIVVSPLNAKELDHLAIEVKRDAEALEGGGCADGLLPTGL